MELDELLNIDTPENVVFGYEIAGIGSRFMAAIVDTIIIVVLQVVVNLVAISIFDSDDSWVIAVLGLVSFAILWGYYIFFELNWSGQSPGKRWVGLRVIRVDGTPIGLTESLIRNLIRLIDFLPFSYGVGVVTMFITSQSRRLGDLAAGTIVVWEQERVSLDSLASESKSLNRPVPWDEETQIDLPIELLSEGDIAMAESFLARRYSLPNKHQLAMDIEKALYNRMGLAVPLSLQRLDAEERLLRIVRAYRAGKAG